MMTTIAISPLPASGQRVEFWVARMDLSGSGIDGWFRRDRFWSADMGDHWEPHEILRWRNVAHESPNPPPRSAALE